MTADELGVSGRRYFACRALPVGEWSTVELARSRDAIAEQLAAGRRVYDVSGELAKGAARAVVYVMQVELDRRDAAARLNALHAGTYRAGE